MLIVEVLSNKNYFIRRFEIKGKTLSISQEKSSRYYRKNPINFGGFPPNYFIFNNLHLYSNH